MTLKTDAYQVGTSLTATQNFSLEVPAVPDGTCKLVRGNAGSGTQDILSVASNGDVGLGGGATNCPLTVSGAGRDTIILAKNTGTSASDDVIIQAVCGSSGGTSTIAGIYCGSQDGAANGRFVYANNPNAYWTYTNGTLQTTLGSTGSLTLHNGDLLFGTSGKGVVGTTAADSAAAGNVGELISSTVASGSAVSLTTATYANVTTISLTAGDWDVSGVVSTVLGGTTSITQMIASVSLSSVSANPATWAIHSVAATVPGATGPALNIAPYRISVASTTTVYLTARMSFTVSTAAAYGRISARRVR